MKAAWQVVAMLLVMFFALSLMTGFIAQAAYEENDEQHEALKQYFWIVEDKKHEEWSLAIMVYDPASQMYVYTDNYMLNADYLHKNQAVLDTGSGEYGLDLKKTLLEVDCWDIDVEDFTKTDDLYPLLAAAPVKGETLTAVYPIYKEKENGLYFVSESTTLTDVVETRKDGGVYLRTGSLFKDIAALPGFLANKEGRCVGIIISQDTAYLDWFDKAVFEGGVSGSKTESTASGQAAQSSSSPTVSQTPKPIPNLKVGDFVSFGSYEQDNKLSNGKEKISWQVLDVRDGKALLISRYGLDSKPYNELWADMTWEECSLRAWLNDDFIRTAFDNSEQKALLLTEVDNSQQQGNSGWNKKGGYDTSDCVFLLSYREANEYFRTADDRLCKPTDYAAAMGAWKNGKGYCHWWLRSPGKTQNYAAYSGSEATFSSAQDNTTTIGVRPAIWVDLTQVSFG